MDVEMRDASRRAPRRGAGNRATSGFRRNDPYSRDHRQRPFKQATSAASTAASAATTTATPFQDELFTNPSTTSVSSMARLPSGMSYPPPELNIKGTSGPTCVVVSNLAKGTSTDDIKLTFSSFGLVQHVKERPQPGPNHPSVSFEVAFERKEDAALAIEKFHGALADGRILSLSIKRPEPARDAYSQFARAAAQAVAERPRDRAGNLIPVPGGPADPRMLAAAAAAVTTTRVVPQHQPQPVVTPIPSMPASMRAKSKLGDLMDPRAKRAAVLPSKSKPPQPAPVKSLAERIPEPLANRLLTPAQAQKLREAEKKQKAKAAARAGAGTGARGSNGTANSLQSRITIPLAARLAAKAGIPSSDASAMNKKKKKIQAKRTTQKQKKTNGRQGM